VVKTNSTPYETVYVKLYCTFTHVQCENDAYKNNLMFLNDILQVGSTVAMNIKTFPDSFYLFTNDACCLLY